MFCVVKVLKENKKLVLFDTVSGCIMTKTFDECINYLVQDSLNYFIDGIAPTKVILSYDTQQKWGYATDFFFKVRERASFKKLNIDFVSDNYKCIPEKVREKGRGCKRTIYNEVKDGSCNGRCKFYTLLIHSKGYPYSSYIYNDSCFYNQDAYEYKDLQFYKSSIQILLEGDCDVAFTKSYVIFRMLRLNYNIFFNLIKLFDFKFEYVSRSLLANMQNFQSKDYILSLIHRELAKYKLTYGIPDYIDVNLIYVHSACSPDVFNEGYYRCYSSPSEYSFKIGYKKGNGLNKRVKDFLISFLQKAFKGCSFVSYGGLINVDFYNLCFNSTDSKVFNLSDAYIYRA